MKIKAYGKINLNLLVLNKREDGKHDLKSVFQKIDLFDELEIKKNKSNKCIIKCNIKELEKDNLLIKAFNILKERFPFITGVDVDLWKRIPMQAGLGGGSSDTAAFIKGMKKLFKLKINKKELQSICNSLGSDVYPCYYDVPVVLDIGDKLRVINSNLQFHLVVIKPDYSCNTGEMYKKLDDIKREKRDTTKDIIRALEDNDLDLLNDNLYNSFEDIMDKRFIRIKEELLNSGALNVLLSGSGSCIFGIYKTKKKALETFNNLKNKYEIYICKSINKKDLDN